MERLQNQPLSLSCKTLVLKQSDKFISAFPGKIIFGDVSQQNYKKYQYFMFAHFELYHLYLSLVEIIKNIVLEETSEINKTDLIIKLSDDLSYFWIIEIDTKNIQFLIKHEAIVHYKLTFSLDQLNDFIYSLSESILPCLCLKSVERDFLQFVSEQEIKILLNLRKENAYFLLNNFQHINKVKIDLICEPNMTDLVIYYIELIIIFKKIKSLVRTVDENNHLRTILSE